MILSIDDDEFNHVILERELKFLGLTCLTCYSSKEAIDILEMVPNIDLVFLDLYLSDGVDGTGMLKIREKRPDLKKIPFIVLSGLEDLTIMEKAFELGANAYLIKPVKRELLIKQLTKLGIPCSPSK